MFAGVARFVVRHPWTVIGAWVAVVVIALVLSPSLVKYTNADQTAFLPKSFQSVQAQKIINTNFPQQAGASGVVVISRTDGQKLTQDDQATVVALAGALTAHDIPGVRDVVFAPQLISPDHKVALIEISFTAPPGNSAVNAAVGTIRDDTNAVLAKTPLKGGLTGDAAIQVDSTNAYDQAEVIISIATVALIVLLLGLIFRSPIICVLPLVIVGVVHQLVAALVADLASAFGFQVGQILAPILVVVLFGVGTDYIIFLLFRYRERLRAGESYRDALERALVSVGEVVASAALTVAAAFAALLLANLGSLQTLAPGLIVAVLVMMLAALTLVPAIMALLGPRLFWPVGVGEAAESKRAQRLGGAIGARPGRFVVIFGILLIALAMGSLAYVPTYDTLHELPKSTKSLQAFDTMATAFPQGLLGPTEVVVSGNRHLTQSELAPLQAKLHASSGVAQVLDPQISKDGTAAYVTVLLKDNPYSTAALTYVRTTLRPLVQGTVPGDKVLLAGATASLDDVRTSLDKSVNLIFPVALVIIGLILGILLWAVAAPLYLLLGVALAYVATLGITSVVFITLGGLSGLDFSTPVVLYLFVLAIGTDYNIAIAHRLREEMKGGETARAAARITVTHAAPMVDAAAIILAGTFASLMLTGIAQLTEIGFGVAIGIILTAFVLSTRLVPAVSALRRWHFWWPSHFHTRTDEGSPEDLRPPESDASPPAVEPSPA
jgi:RND superfamily putative drug exporter